MARLNEAPCSTESVEALKRRFIRQNRELAKNNSTQSVRIRILEAEISRLLTENLNLRNDILQLRNDLEGAPNKRAFGGVKEQLEAQVQALAQLVAGIGLSQTKKDNAGDNVQRSHATVGWGRGQADPMDGSDGRLPAIREDKSYPRKTLDANELQAMAEANSESPALGSPPVSHFQDEEPIKFEKTEVVEIKKEDEDLESLPANLETRRKKRESGTKLSIRRMSVFSSPEEESKTSEENKAIVAQVPSVKTGAKRKLSSRDDNVKPADEFMFSRRTNSASTSADESSAKEDKNREPVKSSLRRETAKVTAPRLTERKALGVRDVNTDPVVSPKKSTKNLTIKEEKEALKKVVEATKETVKPRTVRDRRSRVVIEEPVAIIPQDNGVQMPEVAEISPTEVTKADLPPKTPATVADLFSAPSTEGSAQPQGGRDTPPPADLAASTDANGRAGRRARTQVNYTEPSLNSKMRRPTKELLDAVGKDGRPLSGMIVKKDAIGLKIEPQDVSSSAWKNLPSAPSAGHVGGVSQRAEPGSPLSKKSTTSTEPMKVLAEPESILPSAASQAIAALIKDSKASAAASRRRSSAALQRSLDADSESVREKKDNHGASIYDFASSSPPRSSSFAMGTSRPNSRSSDRHADTEDGKPERNSRRHSSIASLNSASKVGAVDASSRAPSRFGTGAAAGHKRSMSGTVRVSSDAVGASDEGKPDLRASRRRSMML